MNCHRFKRMPRRDGFGNLLGLTAAARPFKAVGRTVLGRDTPASVLRPDAAGRERTENPGNRKTR